MMPTIILIMALIVLVPIAIASVIAAPPVPTKHRDVVRMISLADIKSHEVVYDLGAGYGNLILEAARSSDSTRIIGIEFSPLHVLICKLKAVLAGVSDRVQTRWGNFYSTHLQEADVVLCFLMPDALNRLKAKFEQELIQGARVVSYLYPVPGWEASLTDDGDEHNLPIYVYHL